MICKRENVHDGFLSEVVVQVGVCVCLVRAVDREIFGSELSEVEFCRKQYLRLQLESKRIEAQLCEEYEGHHIQEFLLRHRIYRELLLLD